MTEHIAALVYLDTLLSQVGDSVFTHYWADHGRQSTKSEQKEYSCEFFPTFYPADQRGHAQNLDVR
jgi:hypothetical protein